MLVAHLFNMAAWQEAAAEWRKTHPKEVAANVKKAVIASIQWQQEHPEEWSAILETWKAVGRAALKEWQKANPKKVAAQAARARELSKQWQQENPKQYNTNLEKWIVVGQVALKEWAVKHPAEVAAHARAAFEKIRAWEDAHPEEAALKKVKAEAARKAWREMNPEKVAASLANAHAELKIWRKENPEKAAAVVEKLTAAGKVALAEWRATHPQEVAENQKKGVAAMKAWGEANQEEYATYIAKAQAAANGLRETDPGRWAENRKKTLDGAKAWRAANPKEALANAVKGLKSWREVNPEAYAASLAKTGALSRERFDQAYAERFKFLKTLIPETGARLRELRKQYPQWSNDQFLTLLQRAVKHGDLIGVAINRRDTLYFPPGSNPETSALYTDRFQLIKSSIPETGVRLCELRKRFPQFTKNELRSIVVRAAKRGDLIGVAINRRDTLYFPAGSNPETTLAEARKNKADAETLRKEEARLRSRAGLEKGWAEQQKASDEAYAERLTLIKPLILGTGARRCELNRRCLQLTDKQIKTFLKRAVKQGDLIRVQMGPGNSRYYLPAEKKAA
jgi:hypothetical protein